jgi:uncharacterized protein YdiU (UPF0061 family)
MLALIKLQNGQEVIGNVKEDLKTMITLEDPLQINYRLVATQPMPTVSVSRYMPFSAEQIFTFNKKDLLHIAEPRPAMAEYYQHALYNYKEVIDENVEQELMQAVGMDKDLDDGDEITDAYRALLERMNFKGPLN